MPNYLIEVASGQHLLTLTQCPRPSSRVRLEAPPCHAVAKRRMDPTQAGIHRHRVFRDPSEKEHPTVRRVPALQAFEFHTPIVPHRLTTLSPFP